MVGATLAIAAYTACGNSGDGKTSGTTPDGRLTKSEYIEQGDVNCAQALERTDPKRIPEPRSDTPDEWIRYLESRQRVVAPLDAEFKALKAPLGDTEVADQLNKDLDAMSAEVQEALAAAKSGDTRRVHDLLAQWDAIHDDFNRRAKQYGFKQCPKVE